jgi:vesicular inhibitory amino acid transporter
MIKARRVTGSASSTHQNLITQRPMALQVDASSINQPPMRPAGELTTKSACFTVLSVYVGLGLLSIPYVVAKGGWLSIPILAFFCIIANISGKMLVNCFNTPECNTISTYAQIVDSLLGYWGAIFLVILVSCEFFAGLCISLIFIWRNLETLMPGSPSLWIRVISSAVSLPTMWIVKLSKASWLTVLGFMSSVLIVITLIFVRIWYGELEDVNLDNTIGPNLPLSIGIFMLSLSGHAALPQIYREMSKPALFNRMLDTSFLIMFFVYTIAGAVGYLTYGSSSDIVISTSLVQNPGGLLPKLTTGLVLARNYLTLNLQVSVISNGCEVMMGIDKNPVKQRTFRSLSFIIGVVVADIASDALPFIESVTGAICTTVTSFILPALLFWLLKRKLSYWKVTFKSAFFGLVGLAMMVFLTYGSINSLLHPDAKNNKR